MSYVCAFYVSYHWERISRFYTMRALMLRLPVDDVRMIYRKADINGASPASLPGYATASLTGRRRDQ